MDSYRLAKLIEFLKEEFPNGIQTFFTKNLVGDYMYVIYDEDDISVEYCPTWNYIEIFGLDTYERSIIKEGMNERDIWGR